MTAFEKTAVALSFVLTSVIGYLFVYAYWAAEGEGMAAIGRAGLFVVIMASIHAVGYQLYQQQARVADFPKHPGLLQIPSQEIFDSYAGAIKLALIQQVVIVTLSALLLDGGGAFRICQLTFIAHWVCIAMIIIRRPANPTRFDLAVIKYGFVPLLFIVGQMAQVVHRMIGN